MQQLCTKLACCHIQQMCALSHADKSLFKARQLVIIRASGLCIVYVYPSLVYFSLVNSGVLYLLLAMQGVVTVGDYDGVVSQIHLESGHFIADLDDHGGQRSAVLHICHNPLLQ